MEQKRLTRTDYLFSLIFIFMLICVLGAFFYGLRTGQQQAEAKYQETKTLKAEAAEIPDGYEQQALVSFYHTIYLPYREFEQKWFQSMSELEQQNSIDASAKLRELGKIAEKQYDELQAKSLPPSAPLLSDAQQNYLKGLSLFGEAVKAMTDKANSVKGTTLIDELTSSAYYKEARDDVLKAQKDYFDSIVKWNQSIDANLKPVEVERNLSLEDWEKLTLNNKNDYIASVMLKQQWFKPFKPQDVTLKVDEFVMGGEAKKLGAGSVQQAVDMLIATDAVRTGDFIRGKQRFYRNEVLPQLPFFIAQN